MRTYAGVGSRSLATTTNNKTLCELTQPSTALKRLMAKFIAIGSDATADNAYTVKVQRVTAAGSGGTSWTPTALDPADGAASALFRYAETTDPTITSSSDLLSLSGHQRANIQWYAPPGGELVVPVTNSNGIALVCTVLVAAFNSQYTVHWEE